MWPGVCGGVSGTEAEGVEACFEVGGFDNGGVWVWVVRSACEDPCAEGGVDVDVACAAGFAVFGADGDDIVIE